MCDFFLWGFVKDNVYAPPLPKTPTELRERITPQSGTSHKTCLGGFGGNWSIAWTCAVSHVGGTSDAFKVTMKLRTFLFQMVVTSCISVQYLWKYGFAKSSGNLYAPCTNDTQKPTDCVFWIPFMLLLSSVAKEERHLIARVTEIRLPDMQWCHACVNDSVLCL